MTIRAATEADRAAIEALIHMFPDRLIQNEEINMENFLAAEEGGAVVGCCSLEVYSKKIAEVRSLAVHPDHQRKGIATALVEACVARAKERGVHEVLAITSSVEFFDKQGFKPFHEEKYALFRILD